MTTFVLCKDARTNDDSVVKIEQKSRTTLKCEGKVYTIDPEFRKIFKLHNCVQANPQKNGLYTMFYLDDNDRSADAIVNETWHDVRSRK